MTQTDCRLPDLTCSSSPCCLSDNQFVDQWIAEALYLSQVAKVLVQGLGICEW